MRKAAALFVTGTAWHEFLRHGHHRSEHFAHLFIPFDKFGVDFEKIEELYATAAADMPNLRLRGLQMHIGSQLTLAGPFAEAVDKVKPLAKPGDPVQPEPANPRINVNERP